MPNITGQLEDFDGVKLTHGQLLVEFYGESARADGSDVRLGHEVFEIKDLPNPLTLVAGTYVFTVIARRTDPAADNRATFETQRWAWDLTADTTWGAIRTSAGPLPQQLTDTGQQMLAEMTAIRDQTAAISGLTGEDAAVAFLVNDALSQTRGALDGKYVPSVTVGAADGVAGLDATARVPESNLPAHLAEATIDGKFSQIAHRPVNVAEGYGRDDAGVRAAVAAALAGSRSLYFPAGPFAISGDLALDLDALTLRGDGDQSALTFNGGALILDGAATVHAQRNKVSDLKVHRTGAAGPAIRLKGGGVGTGVVRFGFNDVHASSTSGTAWLVEGSYIGTFHNCYGRSSALGLKITKDVATSVVGGNLLIFTGGEFQGNTKGAELDTTAGVTFVGTGWEGNSAAGMELLDNCRAITILNPYCEANGGYDLKVGTTTSAIALTVLGGYFADGSVGKAQSIDLIRADQVQIERAFFSGFGANSPIAVHEAFVGGVKGGAVGNWSNGSAPIVALNGAAQFGGEPRRWRHASAVLDFPSIGVGASANLTVSVPGAVVGDDATVHYNGTPPAGLMPMAWVSAADTVTVRVSNFSAAAVDPPAATMRVNVLGRA